MTGRHTERVVTTETQDSPVDGQGSLSPFYRSGSTLMSTVPLVQEKLIVPPRFLSFRLYLNCVPHPSEIGKISVTKRV